MVSGAATKRLVQAFRGSCVSAGDNHEIGIVPRIDCCLGLLDHLAGGNYFAPEHVATAHGKCLVLDMNSRCTSAFVFAHDAPDVERVTVAGIAIGDQRQIDDVAKSSHPLR